MRQRAQSRPERGARHSQPIDESEFREALAGFQAPIEEKLAEAARRLRGLRVRIDPV
jgi:hypothetical protein